MEWFDPDVDLPSEGIPAGVDRHRKAQAALQEGTDPGNGMAAECNESL